MKLWRRWKRRLSSEAPLPVDWSQATLGKLIDHIVTTHHAYVKSELPRLAVLAQKVVNRHGDTQAHLPAMQSLLVLLDDELIHHLGKEEHVLFPYIAKLEGALLRAGRIRRRALGRLRARLR